MFESLSDKLRDVLKGLRGESRLTEENIDAALRNVRIALLEADVNYQVVKQFIDRTRERALGTEVVGSLKPEQVLYKVVYDEMTEMLGGTSSRILFPNKRGPNVVMMVGLQGSGKTTSTGKLAKWLQANERRNPLLVSVDVYRPAARDQLKVIGQAIGRRVFHPEGVDDPQQIVALALKEAELTGFDTLMIDTAGRLHIDDSLMVELEQIKAATNPVEVLFVADAMTGQDAVKSAKEFHDRIGVDRRPPDEDGRRRPWRRRALDQGSHRTADQVHRRRREVRRARAVLSRPHCAAHPRNGRRPVAGREGAVRGRREGRAAAPEEAAPRTSSPSRTSATSSSRSRNSARSTASSECFRQACSAGCA